VSGARPLERRPAILCGSLAAFPVWEVVQWIAQSAPEGVLELERTDGATLRLHCREGVLAAVDWDETAVEGPDRRPDLEPCAGRLGAILAADGRVGLPQLRIALAVQADARRTGRAIGRLGRLLQSIGALSAGSLADALRAQARERVMRALAWREGRFRFVAGPPARPGTAVGERIEHWLMERARDLDAAGPPEPAAKTRG
jgi:hypothetical protein